MTCIDIKKDTRDEAIVAERMAAYDAIDGPRVGDFVIFADDVVHRISHLWPNGWDDEEGKEIPQAQTSGGGSFYLGHGHVSFSGSLYPGIRVTTLTQDGASEGGCWIFHHDFWGAGRGVDFTVPFRVFRCADSAPQ